MVYDKARELAKLLSTSEEYKEYKEASDKAFENETTKALIKEYHQLQMQAQASVVSGKKDDALLERLQKVGEVLQLNSDASRFLIAEFRLNRMLGDVYKILAEAIDIDLGMLEG
ncbi:MAG: YlbF family regulator [Clostridia bacterium]|nr:YlbF family regulator [Clostridia bacterium]